jgi:hypothetical protein
MIEYDDEIETVVAIVKIVELWRLFRQNDWSKSSRMNDDGTAKPIEHPSIATPLQVQEV